MSRNKQRPHRPAEPTPAPATPAHTPHPHPTQKPRTKRSALIVGAAVMGSRLMGVIREQVFAFMFGATMFADAFIAAFRIPNLLRDLFAEGALSTAFTATFTKKWEKEGHESAWHLARLVLSTLTLALGVICILGIICGPAVVELTSSGWGAKQPATFALTVEMTRILFPFILFVSLAAAVMGMLNARNVFGIPASASTVFNVVSVISGAGLAALFDPQKDWLHPHFGREAIFGWCLGVLLGGLAQLGMQLPVLWKLGFRYRWELDFKDPGLRTVLVLMVPSVIAGSAVQVNVLVNGEFASYINGSGPVSWLYYAFRLVQLPIGIFGVAIATVTLPAVARQHARHDLKAFGETVQDALRFGFFLTLPASIGLAVMAHPIIQLIYEHGSFTAHSTHWTALALQAYTIGLAGYSGIKILVPCFYAMDPPEYKPQPGASNWVSMSGFVREVMLFTPARVSLIGIGLNLALCVLFDWVFGLGAVGLAMATGFVAILNFLQLLYAIQKKIHLGDPREWASFFARVSAASLTCGLVALVGNVLLLGSRSTYSLLGSAILFTTIAAAGLAYLSVTMALDVPEARELTAFLRRKFGKKA